MSVSLYQQFVRDNENDAAVCKAFDALLSDDAAALSALSDQAKRELIDALGRMIQNPQFELMAKSLQLRLGERFESFVPTLFRDAAARTSIPTLETLFAGLDRNRDLYRRLRNAQGDNRLQMSLFIAARGLLPRVDYDMAHDSGFIALMLGCLYLTGGGSISSGMEFGNAGAEGARLLLGDHYRDAYIAMHLPFENPGLFPLTSEMTTTQESFITRKMGVFNGSDLYVAAAGGYGTMDEALSVLALMMNGAMPPKDIVLLESTKDGQFWLPFFEYLNALIASGAVSPAVRDLISYARDNDEFAKTVAYIQRRKREEEDSETGFDARFTTAHPKQDKMLRETVRADRELIDTVFSDLDRKRTVSVFGPEGSVYDAAYAEDGAALAQALDGNAALAGANILVNGTGTFGDHVRSAAQNLSRGALLSVQRALDPKIDSGASDKSGVVRFYNDAFFKAAMMYHSSAAVFYPGGINTQSALFEIMTLMQTLQIPHFPVVLVGGKEKWAHFDELARSFVAYGTIGQDDLEYNPETKKGLYTIVETTADAARFLETSGFTKNTPQFTQRPHKEPSSQADDHAALYVRELKKRDFTAQEAAAIAHRLVHEVKINPAQALARSPDLLSGMNRGATRALAKKEHAEGYSVYTRMLAGALSLGNDGESLRRVTTPQKSGAQPKSNLTGRLFQTAQTAIQQGTSPTAAARKLVGNVTAKDVNFPLHSGMRQPGVLPLAPLPLFIQPGLARM